MGLRAEVREDEFGILLSDSLVVLLVFCFRVTSEQLRSTEIWKHEGACGAKLYYTLKAMPVRGGTITTLAIILLGKTKDTGNQWDSLAGNSPLFTSAADLTRPPSAGSGTRRGVVRYQSPKGYTGCQANHTACVVDEPGRLHEQMQCRRGSAFLSAKSDKAFDPNPLRELCSTGAASHPMPAARSCLPCFAVS